MAVAYGIESSETLVLTEHAIPLAPLAGESKNLSHSASFSSALRSSDNRKGNADARAWCAIAFKQLIHLFGNSRQHERTTRRSVGVPVQESWYPASLLALTETHFERAPLEGKRVRRDYEE